MIYSTHVTVFMFVIKIISISTKVVRDFNLNHFLILLNVFFPYIKNI